MRPRLEMRHLEMIRTLAETTSLAEAARELHVTPSALSHRIKEMERRLDAPLYERRGRVLRRTPAADILLETARRTLDEVSLAEQIAIASSSGARHHVRLTVGVYNCYHWLPSFLPPFRDAHPDIDIEIDGEGSLTPFERLADDVVDIVVTPSPVYPDYTEEHRLFTDELVAVVSPGHHLADRLVVEAEDLTSETYFTYSHVREPGFEADRVWGPAGVRPTREVVIGSISAICEMIRAGLGVSILSRWALRPFLEAGDLRAIQVGDGVDISWRAVTKRGGLEDGPVARTTHALTRWIKPAA